MQCQFLLNKLISRMKRDHDGFITPRGFCFHWFCFSNYSKNPIVLDLIKVLIAKNDMCRTP